MALSVLWAVVISSYRLPSDLSACSWVFISPLAKPPSHESNRTKTSFWLIPSPHVCVVSSPLRVESLVRASMNGIITSSIRCSTVPYSALQRANTVFSSNYCPVGFYIAWDECDLMILSSSCILLSYRSSQHPRKWRLLSASQAWTALTSATQAWETLSQSP